MAFDSFHAALAGYFASNLILDGQVTLSAKGQAAHEILEHVRHGGAVFEDLSFRGNSALVAVHNDELARAFYASGASELQRWLHDYVREQTLASGRLPLDERVTTCTISRDITQASTLSLGIEDFDRKVLNSPAVARATTLKVGPIGFVLVKVAKRQHQTSLVFEDSVVAKLRGIKGAMAAAPGVVNRVHFAAQLCRSAGVPFIGAPGTPSAKEPLSRGTSSEPNEDTWTCLVRLAQAVQYRCFSDGTSIVFGPDSWLFAAAPVMTIQEFDDGVDFIDLNDWDTGKPLAEASVYTYAPQWRGDLGAIIKLRGVGPGSAAKWMVSKIDRDLYHTPTTVGLVAPQPTLPEPEASGA